MRTRPTLPSALALVALLACGDDPAGPTDPPVPVVATIEVTPGADTLTAIAETVHLTAVARDSTGAEIPGVTFSWASSDSEVAAVDEGTGLATAKAVGTAAITASAGGKSDAAGLLVAQAVATVEVEPGSWSPGWESARQQFSATARDANGYPVPGVTFSWLSSEPAIARVDQEGIVTALTEGTAMVTATGADSTGEATVTVPRFGDVLDGVVYTVWFARSDSAPALLVDGRIRNPNIWDEPTPASSQNWLPPEVGGNPTVHKFQWRGDRIGVLTDVVGGVGNLYVRDRIGEWRLLAQGNAADFALSGDLLVLVRSDGALMVREAIDGPWATLSSSGVRDWQVAGGKFFGLVDGAGAFWAKDGVNGPWYPLAGGGVKDFQITSGGRIGLLSEDGEFKVKDGVTGPWTTLANPGGGIEAFRLNGDRIAALHSDGRLRAKDGINGAWATLIQSGVKEFALGGNHIAVLREDGSVIAKEGINGGWVDLASGGVRAIQLQGDLIGWLTDGGVLRVKEGLNGIVRSTSAHAGGITQFRLLVDVPVPPARITPAEYVEEQQDCFDDIGGVDCTSPWQTGVVPIYGRNCGWGIPTDEDAERARQLGLGPIDPMDALCVHHDNPGWYPEAIGVDACIVRYGLHYSRLTRDGSLLTHGNDSKAGWDAAWDGMMPNLKSIVDRYFTEALSCPLSGFTNDTASQN